MGMTSGPLVCHLVGVCGDAKRRYIKQLCRGESRPLILCFDIESTYHIQRNLVGHTIVDIDRGTFVGPLHPSGCVPFCAEYEDDAYALLERLATDAGAVTDLAKKVRGLIPANENLVIEHRSGVGPTVVRLLHEFPGKVVAFTDNRACYALLSPDEYVLPWARRGETWGWE
jgi:hypothetical protein